MIRFLSVIIPLAILAASGAGTWWLLVNRPETKMQEVRPVLVQVEGTRLKKTSFPVVVTSQGMVQPRTQTTLLPEVSAKIVESSSNFKPGGFFEKGEVLMKLDPVDYETAVVVAQAAVAQAESMLAEELAKAEQALENWKALGRSGEPNALAMRKPQVAKAHADVASAKAQVLKAERDLERTTIRAPFAGQVLEQLVDVGQLVTSGTQLAKVFAVDYVEIRLPLPERGMRFLALPENYRDGSESAATANAEVRLNAVMNGKLASWRGRIVRVEGAMDASTRQIIAVAQVDDPYAKRSDGLPPLKVGQFVEAEITGETLQDVYVIPRSAVRAGNEIILISPKNTLRRVLVEPLVSDEKQIVIAANAPKAPQEGEVLCLTPIPFPADGARVDPVIDGKASTVGMAKSDATATKPVPAPKGGPS
ncbi:RND family efflux transporter MFP subunit [Roseimicrobium gellanilyticum]|uniref:RND family efflux transporter MFP subunit n=1 Tax=Roseimicrobium gellanilyticum TaxID=748857 RepID=A0A366H6R7_9BACT|nr:efflux RND transporter periplasmic adaptor subunit [Roseimicrobium gellanilyticum]RBP37694.1 RND family efflux transporter MFP subunit [Roseimicrobium gellanilyticum]